MSNAESRRKALRDLIAAGKTAVVPGAHDALSAKLIERAGFPA
jgi:2-methylisocitrate lyase-like PEP mutase family enzyme